MDPRPTSQPSQSAAIARVLGAGVGVAPNYQHVPKHVSAGDPLELPAALLKWYEVHPLDRPVPMEISALARQAFGRGALSVSGLGFVVLHRCGNAFYFLIACTWRNENELWETVWYKDGDAMSEFAEFPRRTSHLPTFCVWEFVPVWSEQQSWVRFLLSQRDAEAAGRWLHEQYQGAA
jgi:hypothetical protein